MGWLPYRLCSLGVKVQKQVRWKWESPRQFQESIHRHQTNCDGIVVSRVIEPRTPVQDELSWKGTQYELPINIRQAISDCSSHLMLWNLSPSSFFNSYRFLLNVFVLTTVLIILSYVLVRSRNNLLWADELRCFYFSNGSLCSIFLVEMNYRLLPFWLIIFWDSRRSDMVEVLFLIVAYSKDC